MHDLNAENDRLTAKYVGDKKFMRIHKRLSSQFSSPTALNELLIELKQTIDGELFRNYAIINNTAYFEGNIRRDLVLTLENFPASNIRNIAKIVAQEYIDERNAVS